MITVDAPFAAAVERLIKLARERGFIFTPAGEHGSQWAERVTSEWVDVVFLDVSGPCNAVRSRRGHVVPGEPLFAERVSGPALSVLHTVLHTWPPPTSDSGAATGLSARNAPGGRAGSNPPPREPR